MFKGKHNSFHVFLVKCILSQPSLSQPGQIPHVELVARSRRAQSSIYIYIYTHVHIYIYIYIYIIIVVIITIITGTPRRELLHIFRPCAAPPGSPPPVAASGSCIHPVSITRFPLSRFSPGAGLLRNTFFTLSMLNSSRGWVRKDGNLVMETGCMYVQGGP